MPVRVINIIVINIINEANIIVDSTDQDLFSIFRKLSSSLWKWRRDFVGADKETLENDGTINRANGERRVPWTTMQRHDESVCPMEIQFSKRRTARKSDAFIGMEFPNTRRLHFSPSSVLSLQPIALTVISNLHESNWIFFPDSCIDRKVLLATLTFFPFYGRIRTKRVRMFLEGLNKSKRGVARETKSTLSVFDVMQRYSLHSSRTLVPFNVTAIQNTWFCIVLLLFQFIPVIITSATNNNRLPYSMHPFSSSSWPFAFSEAQNENSFVVSLLFSVDAR